MLTILGLGSFSIFIRLGRVCFMAKAKSGLDRVDCTLNSSYSAKQVFYFIEPYRVIERENFDWAGYF